MNETTARAGRRKWLAFAVLGVVWGTTWIATEALGESVPPLRGAATRFLLAALLLIPVILWKRLKLPCRRIIGYVLLLSVTMIALPFVLLLWAGQHVSSATVAVLFAAMPLLVALLTPFLEGRTVAHRALHSAVVGLGAIVLAVGASFPGAQAGSAAVAFVGVALIGASSLIARRELKSVHPIMVTALLLGAAAVLLFLASVALERGQPVGWNRNAVGSLVFLAAVAGAPAYAVYFWLLQQLEAYQMATVQWIETLVAIMQTAFFLRLSLSFAMIAGSLVTLTTLLWVMRARTEDDDTVSLLRN